MGKVSHFPSYEAACAFRRNQWEQAGLKQHSGLCASILNCTPSLASRSKVSQVGARSCEQGPRRGASQRRHHELTWATWLRTTAPQICPPDKHKRMPDTSKQRLDDFRPF
ncbi:unnamed protein product [Arctogadus glacialis]